MSKRYVLRCEKTKKIIFETNDKWGCLEKQSNQENHDWSTGLTRNIDYTGWETHDRITGKIVIC